MSTASMDQINTKISPSHEISVDEKSFDERMEKIAKVFSRLKTETLEGRDLQDRCFDEILRSCKRNKWEKLQTIRKEILGIRNSKGETIFEVYERDTTNFHLHSPENLVFQGGGPKGIAYIGAIRVLEERNILPHAIKRVAGTSAGAITAALLAMGFSSGEIYNFLVERPLTDFLDFSPSCGGICAGTEFFNWINNIIEKRTGIPNCTFGELRKKIESGGKFKHLHVCSIKVGAGANNEAFYFSSEDRKWNDLIIASALFSSMCLPYIYQPYTLIFKNPKDQICYPDEKRSFMDGGIAGKLFNLPIGIFDQKKFTQKGCSVCEERNIETNKRTLAFSLYTPGKGLPKEDRQVTCILDGASEYGKSKKHATSIYSKTQEEVNKLRTVRISNTQVGTILGFFEDKDKLGELIESGRAATLGFFQEQEEQLDRLSKLDRPTEEIIFHREVKKAFYHTFKNDFSRGSMLAVEIVGDRISFHTNYIASGASLANPSRDQFSFTKLAALDDRFWIFRHLRNARVETTDTPEKSIERTASLKSAEDLYKQHESFFKKCFYWDIFRKLIIERNISEYLTFFMSKDKGFSFNTPTLNPVSYAYHCGAFKSFEVLLQDPTVDLKIVEPETNKTLLYYMAKEGQIDFAKAYCEAYKKRHPKSYQKLLDHRVNSTSGVKKSALDIALEKGKNEIVAFLAEEGVDYQYYYSCYKEQKYPVNMLIGAIKRKLSKTEKLNALWFCLTSVYQRRYIAHNDYAKTQFAFDHSEGYEYAENLIRNKIMTAPCDNIMDSKGNGLLLTVLKYTTSPLARGRLTRLLLEGKFRPNINQVNNYGVTPLIAAARFDPEGFDFFEQSYVRLSAYGLNEADVVGWLLSVNGIDVNYQNYNGNTALHHAVSMKARRNIESLLSHKDIDPNIPNNLGQTPLHLTLDGDIIKLLKDAGAKDTLVNARGVTLQDVHKSLMKPNYEGFGIYYMYKEVHEDKGSLEWKIFSGTVMTISSIIALPMLAVGEVYTAINHATTEDGSFCTCVSCTRKRGMEGLALPKLSYPWS